MLHEAYARAMAYRGPDGRLAHMQMQKKVYETAVFTTRSDKIPEGRSPAPREEKMKPCYRVEMRNTQKARLSKDECSYCRKKGHWKRDCPLLIEASGKSGKTDGKSLTLLTKKAILVDRDEEFSFCTLNNHITATVNIFKNPKLLKNIRQATHSIAVNGMGGRVVADMVGDFEGFGEVYYHPGSIANILSFYDIQRKFPVTYDSKENTFEVHTSSKVILFKPRAKLYIWNPRKHKEEVAMVETISATERLFTKREVEIANEARLLQRRLG